MKQVFRRLAFLLVLLAVLLQRPVVAEPLLLERVPDWMQAFALR